MPPPIPGTGTAAATLPTMGDTASVGYGTRDIDDRSPRVQLIVPPMSLTVSCTDEGALIVRRVGGAAEKDRPGTEERGGPEARPAWFPTEPGEGSIVDRATRP
jgi:hypothetical protein